MSIEEARTSVGKMVFSEDPGLKMVRSVPKHGPYLLKRVTKGGMAVVQVGPGEQFHRPSLLSLA